MKCSHWWWIGHLCASLPNLCQAAPGQVDTARLVELLCTEISSLRSDNTSPRSPTLSNGGFMDAGNRGSTLPSLPRPPPISSTNSSSNASSTGEQNTSQVNWMKVKQVSMAVAAFQKAAKRANDRQRQIGRVRIITGDSVHDNSDEEKRNAADSDIESSSSGCECGEFMKPCKRWRRMLIRNRKYRLNEI